MHPLSQADKPIDQLPGRDRSPAEHRSRRGVGEEHSGILETHRVISSWVFLGSVLPGQVVPSGHDLRHKAADLRVGDPKVADAPDHRDGYLVANALTHLEVCALDKRRAHESEPERQVTACPAIEDGMTQAILYIENIGKQRPRSTAFSPPLASLQVPRRLGVTIAILTRRSQLRRDRKVLGSYPESIPAGKLGSQQILVYDLDLNAVVLFDFLL